MRCATFSASEFWALTRGFPITTFLPGSRADGVQSAHSFVGIIRVSAPPS